MYRRLPQSQGNVIGYEITDRITEDDFDEVATELHEAIDDYGTVRVLVRAPAMPDQEFIGTLEDRLRFLRDDLEDVERYALVTDDATADWVGKVADEVLPTELEHFESAREPEAWRWVAGT